MSTGANTEGRDPDDGVVAVRAERNRLCVSCLYPCAVVVEVGTQRQRQSFHLCADCAYLLRVDLENNE